MIFSIFFSLTFFLIAVLFYKSLSQSENKYLKFQHIFSPNAKNTLITSRIIPPLLNFSFCRKFLIFFIYDFIIIKKVKFFLIFESIPINLDKIFSVTNSKFSIKTESQIGYQMIQRIELINSKGYIHRDIKSGHFLILKI